MKRFIMLVILVCYTSFSVAQSINYNKAMDDIMANHIDDYPEASIRAFDKLFEDVNIVSLPAETQFFYYYYLGGCYYDAKQDDNAITYLSNARNIAYSNYELGIRNKYVLDAEYCLADLYISKDTYEYRALAWLLYNNTITIGVSLIEHDSYNGNLVVMALVEQAKMGVEFWWDAEWVKKIWLRARDLAIEINDSTAYSYYVINVVKYYCDLGEYDTALSFMEDAKNKEILEIDASSYIDWINKIKNYIALRDELKKSKGLTSMDYWSNEFWIAGASAVLCSNEVAIKILQDVEVGLKHNNLTNSYEYAQTIHLLADLTVDMPQVAETYLIEQISIFNTTPEYYNSILEVDLYNQLGGCQLQLGKYTDAYCTYNKALKCLEQYSDFADMPGYKNDLAVIYHNIGRVLYFLKDYSTSIDFFERSIAIQEEANGSVWPKTRVYLSEVLDYINKK